MRNGPYPNRPDILQAIAIRSVREAFPFPNQHTGSLAMTIGELIKKLSLYQPHLRVIGFREGEIRDISQVFKVPGKIDRTGKELEDRVIYISLK